MRRGECGKMCYGFNGRGTRALCVWAPNRYVDIYLRIRPLIWVCKCAGLNKFDECWSEIYGYICSGNISILLTATICQTTLAFSHSLSRPVTFIFGQ